MREKLGRVIAWLAALSALVLLALALDWVPSRSAAPPIDSPFDETRLAEPIEPTHQNLEAQGAAAAQAALPLTVFSLPVCEAPEKGARVYSVPLGATPSLFVWCKGAFVRVDLSLRAEAPQAQRSARFPARAELPGGVVAQDFDADGVQDLILATAPPPQVLHRPGAGVFLVRGRKAGGYEPAVALVETPVSALFALPAEEGGAAQLVVLTRGDVSAQRPGELWLFAGGSTLRRVAQEPLGVGPRDLVVTQLGTGPERTVWSALPGAGRVLAVELSSTGGKVALGKPQDVAFAGVQGLIASAFAEPSSALFARDARDVKQVSAEGQGYVLVPFAERVNAGPGIVVDLDADSRAEVLAVIDGGVTRAFAAGQAEHEELALSGHFASVLDVTAVRDEAARERGVALAVERDSDMLSLLILPRPPWGEHAELIVQRVQVAEQAGHAVVALE